MRSSLLPLLLLVSCAPACSPPPPPPARAPLRVLSPSVPDSLDPTQDSRLSSRNVFFNVFEPLVRVDAGGQLVPAVAESWVNPTADAYQFTIRSGARFQDGEPLVPADVVASLERARAPGSLIAGNLAEVVEIRVAGPRVVALRTRAPSALLLHALTAIPIWRPGPPGRPPVGTGPYLVEDFQPGVKVLLRRFTDYYDAAPPVESVLFERVRGETEVLDALRSGERAIVMDPSRAAVALAQHDARFRVATGLSGSVVYLAFDLARSPTPGVKLPVNPYRDVRVRRAFRLALDLEALIRDAAPMGGLPASQLAPPGVFGFDPALRTPRRNLPGARELLREAGLASGFATTLDVRRNDTPLGEALARQLGEVGVRVEVHPLASDAFSQTLDGGRSSLYAYNWVLGQESGEALKNFFHTRDPASGLGIKNRTGYSNPRLDAVLDGATGAVDREARRKLLYQAMNLLIEDLPWVPLFVDRTTRLYPRDLDFPSRVDGMLVLREAQPASSP